jgi:hypothetical protein
LDNGRDEFQARVSIIQYTDTMPLTIDCGIEPSIGQNYERVEELKCHQWLLIICYLLQPKMADTVTKNLAIALLLTHKSV